MGKNKQKAKANVFKVAGAKSLKKSKTKAVNIGLKNMKQKVQDIDAEFLQISKTPRPSPPAKPEPKKQGKKSSKKIPTKEDISKTAEDIVKMDI